MAAYLIRRLVAILPIAFIVSLIAFLLVQFSPGDPTSFFIGPDSTPEEVQAIRERLGIDRPIAVQYFEWLGRAVRGDLGISFAQNRSVLAAYLSAFPVTASLALLSLVLALLISLPIGTLSALKPGSYFDRIATIFVFIGVSMPNFWLGMLLVIGISLNFDAFPAQGFDTTNLWTRFTSLLLPAIALGYSQAALMARMTRTSLMEVMREDYVQTARAKGLRYKVVLSKHAFANAFNPVLTVIGLSVAALFAGSVVVELVFNLPGIGRLTVNSIARRDYPMIQGVLLLTAVVVIVVNLVVDLLYAVLDPRIRYD